MAAKESHLRRAICSGLLAALVGLSACTDWDEAGGSLGPQLQSGGGATGLADATATTDGGLSYLETWQPPPVDAASDATVLADSVAVDDVAEPADATPAALADVVTPPDVTVYTLDGKGDFVGWPDSPAADATATAGDGSTTDDGAADSSMGDGAVVDGGDPSSDGGVASDAGGGVADAGSGADAGGADGGASIDDGGALSDAAVVADASSIDGGGADGEVAAADVPTLPDGAALPDWQGYGDLPFADGADIFGGAINSCLALYLYQAESCGAVNPTASCIDAAAKEGSLYAQFLFEPLQQCEKAACVDLCQGASDKSCWEQCIAKYCPAQFFACTSNAQQGNQSCGEAWTCASAFPDKLLTISSKCYAAASQAAQLQLSAVVSCITAPQTASCVPEIAACYGGGQAADASCAASLQCLGACNGDQACSGACFGKASPAAVQLLDAAVACLNLQCAPQCQGDKACQDACAATTCKNQFAACAAN